MLKCRKLTWLGEGETILQVAYCLDVHENEMKKVREKNERKKGEQTGKRYITTTQ